MKKSPSFPMFTSDFLEGTNLLSLAEVGAYTRLLCRSWEKGPVPKDADKLARWMGADLLESQRIWSVISEKFIETKKGFRNKKLEGVRKAKHKYQKEQSEKAKRKWELERQKKGAAAQPRQKRGTTNAAARQMLNSTHSTHSTHREDRKEQVQDQNLPAKTPMRSIA